MEESKQARLVRVPQEFTVERYEVRIHPKMLELRFSAECQMSVTIKERDVEAIRLHMQELVVESVTIVKDTEELNGVNYSNDAEYIDHTFKITYNGVFKQGQKYTITIRYSGEIQHSKCEGVCIGIDDDVKGEYGFSTNSVVDIEDSIRERHLEKILENTQIST
jgi:aminopeptidase N